MGHVAQVNTCFFLHYRIMDWKCTMMSIIFFNVILKGTSDLRKWKNPDHDYIEALVSITMHKLFEVNFRMIEMFIEFS